MTREEALELAERDPLDALHWLMESAGCPCDGWWTEREPQRAMELARVALDWLIEERDSKLARVIVGALFPHGMP